jgi:hypothetical protein
MRHFSRNASIALLHREALCADPLARMKVEEKPLRGLTLLKLRLVARFDLGLRLRLAKFRLVVNHLADAGQHRALDLHIG